MLSHPEEDENPGLAQCLLHYTATLTGPRYPTTVIKHWQSSPNLQKQTKNFNGKAFLNLASSDTFFLNFSYLATINPVPAMCQAHNYVCQ